MSNEVKKVSNEVSKDVGLNVEPKNVGSSLLVGMSDGSSDSLGSVVGDLVGLRVGLRDGFGVGGTVGRGDGRRVGTSVLSKTFIGFCFKG